MSPRSTFQSCGNSSKLDFRSTFPNEVKRSTSSLSPVFIERNLYKVNSFPRKPGRVCENNMGRPLNASVNNETQKRIGENKISSTSATRISVHRFTIATPFERSIKPALQASQTYCFLARIACPFCRVHLVLLASWLQ